MHVAAVIDDRSPVSPDEVFEADEEFRAARRALEQLKPSEQRVIALRDVNGWSYDEIARFEGVTVESIRGSLKRARTSLRRSFAQLGAGVPAVAGLAPLRRLRDAVARLAGSAQRSLGHVGSQAWMAEAGVGIVAAALVVGSVGGASAPADVGAPVDTALRLPAGADSAAPAAGGDAPDRPIVPEAGSRPAAAPTTGEPQRPPYLLPGDVATRPEDAVLTEFAASPSYDRDGTVFAVGSVGEGCAYAPCAVAFRSTDRGVSWTRLEAVGFQGGALLLPSSYPADPRIFAAGPTALQVSHDGGRTFAAVAPLGGSAAISPTFAQDGRIVLGQAPGWEYRDAVGGVRPSSTIVRSSTVAINPVFSPTYADDGALFVGATTLNGIAQHQATVFNCVEAVCSGVPLPGAMGAPAVAVGPAPSGAAQPVAAWRGDMLFRSLDAGRRFDRADLPLSGYIRSVAFDSAGRMLVGVRDGSAEGSSGGLVVSADGGTSWTRIGGAHVNRGVEAVAALPDGRILVSLPVTAGGGVLCSTDSGASWERRCD